MFTTFRYKLFTNGFDYKSCIHLGTFSVLS
nr:MAG TPA: hypothetical protein [Caudoviricetes sp.]